MSGEYRYSVHDIRTRDAQVYREDPLLAGWREYIPLSTKSATYHILLRKNLDDPIGLIELSDGSVITGEDAGGEWDPTPATVVPITKSAAEALHATESDFFKRQLEQIDQQVYAAKYPAGHATYTVPGDFYFAPGWGPLPQTRWWRFYSWLRAWVWCFRERVGYFIAGHDPRDEEE